MTKTNPSSRIIIFRFSSCLLAYIELLIISKGLFVWQGLIDDLKDVAKVTITRQTIQEAKKQWLLHPEIFDGEIPSIAEFAYNYVSYMRHTKKELTQEETNTLYDLISFNPTFPHLEKVESWVNRLRKNTI
ncbi:MAG: hypothetical protein ACXAC8_14075 [Candidatus Hodarchaeales archaeon]|jgi:hypothetical protein